MDILKWTLMVYDKSKNMVVWFPQKKGMDMCKHTQNPPWMVDYDPKSIYYLPQICFGWNDCPRTGIWSTWIHGLFDRQKKWNEKKHRKHPQQSRIKKWHKITKLVQLQQVCLRVVYCWFNGFPAKIPTGWQTKGNVCQDPPHPPKNWDITDFEIPISFPTPWTNENFDDCQIRRGMFWLHPSIGSSLKIPAGNLFESSSWIFPKEVLEVEKKTHMQHMQKKTYIVSTTRWYKSWKSMGKKHVKESEASHERSFFPTWKYVECE